MTVLVIPAQAGIHGASSYASPVPIHPIIYDKLKY
jgi:hypothetical protein